MVAKNVVNRIYKQFINTALSMDTTWHFIHLHVSDNILSYYSMF